MWSNHNRVFLWYLGQEMGESIVLDEGWNFVPVTLSHAPSKRKTSGRNSVPTLMGYTSTSMVYLQMSAGCQSIAEVRHSVQWLQLAHRGLFKKQIKGTVFIKMSTKIDFLLLCHYKPVKRSSVEHKIMSWRIYMQVFFKQWQIIVTMSIKLPEKTKTKRRPQNNFYHQ